MPVKTIARPCSLAAAMTSSSRTEPPGWMTAVTPWRAASSRPSREGKKASEASTEPATGSCVRVARLDEHPARDGPVFEPFGAARLARAQHAQILLRAQGFERRLVVVRRD